MRTTKGLDHAYFPLLSKWPVAVSLRCLHFLDCEGHLTPTQKEFVQTKINQMEIYSEVSFNLY